MINICVYVYSEMCVCVCVQLMIRDWRVLVNLMETLFIFFLLGYFKSSSRSWEWIQYQCSSQALRCAAVRSGSAAARSL